MTLKDFFEQNPQAALAFSGGTDSAYLLYEAHRLGADVRPYFVKTVFQPQFELDDALRFCERLGAELKILSCDILDLRNVASNPLMRCYHCKTAMFSLIWEQARADGYTVLLDGTNASDNADERPGMRVLRELGVRSPLRECGITKTEILSLSRATGLPEKASYSCLATRIPYGTKITPELLTRIEAAENSLFDLGFSDFRVRIFNGAAKLVLKEEQMARAFEYRDELTARLTPVFDTVLLDMRAR